MAVWNFKANAVVDDINAVPEGYRPLYAAGSGEHAGKHVLSPSALALANDYDGVLTTLADERNKSKNKNTEAAGFRTQLAKFTELAQSLGLTVDEGADLAEILKGHVDGLTDQVKGGSEAKINLEKVNGDWKKRLDAATVAEQAKTTKMQGSLERHLIGQAATAALAAAGGSTELLLPHVKSAVKVVQDGEDFVARVVDAQGDVRTGSNGQPMTVPEYVAEMKTLPAFAPAFKSTAGGGTGKTSDTRPAAKTTPTKTDGEKSPQDKIAAGLAARGIK